VHRDVTARIDRVHDKVLESGVFNGGGLNRYPQRLPAIRFKLFMKKPFCLCYWVGGKNRVDVIFESS
jgi:hypothetical protein